METTMSEIEILQDQIKFIDTRLAELEPIIARLKDGDYQKQELLDEQATFAVAHRVADRKLRELTGQDDPVERARREKALARAEAMRAAKVRSYREACLKEAERFAVAGDHRNAKIHRCESLNARAVAEAEIH
jgi:hypothetical protein